MSRLKRLLDNYRTHIAIPWRGGTAAPQRVIFCVYNEYDELKLRATKGEFELVTKSAGHGWYEYDLTDSFARWMSTQRYAHKYFEQPHLISGLMPRYLNYIETEFKVFIESLDSLDNAVVALVGVGSVFGFIKVKDLVDRLAPLVPGRLLVFFPGVYENNNYRLLDGYDGWNYLAVPITADQ